MAQAPPSVLQLSCPLRLQGAPNLPARRGRFKSTQTRHAGAGPQGRDSRYMHSRKSHTLSGCTNDPFRGIPTCPCTLPQANPNPARHPLIPAPQGSPRPTPTRPHPFATPGPPTGPAGRKRTQHPPQKNLQPPAAPRPLLYKKFADCSCPRMSLPQIPESQDRIALAFSNASVTCRQHGQVEPGWPENILEESRVGHRVVHVPDPSTSAASHADRGNWTAQLGTGRASAPAPGKALP